MAFILGGDAQQLLNEQFADGSAVGGRDSGAAGGAGQRVDGERAQGEAPLFLQER
jgi:hypothetical protein